MNLHFISNTCITAESAHATYSVIYDSIYTPLQNVIIRANRYCHGKKIQALNKECCVHPYEGHTYYLLILFYTFRWFSGYEHRWTHMVNNFLYCHYCLFYSLDSYYKFHRKTLFYGFKLKTLFLTLFYCCLFTARVYAYYRGKE